MHKILISISIVSWVIFGKTKQCIKSGKLIVRNWNLTLIKLSPRTGSILHCLHFIFKCLDTDEKFLCNYDLSNRTRNYMTHYMKSFLLISYKWIIFISFLSLQFPYALDQQFSFVRCCWLVRSYRCRQHIKTLFNAKKKRKKKPWEI